MTTEETFRYLTEKVSRLEQVSAIANETAYKAEEASREANDRAHRIALMHDEARVALTTFKLDHGID